MKKKIETVTNFLKKIFQLVYSLNTGRDYGTILCWAENEMGVQSNPCVFHLIPAGKTIIKQIITSSNLYYYIVISARDFVTNEYLAKHI